ncbi:hypothetical protein Gohar_000450, partial [Gossypium harknessii]|nr:hypothetical protein [Gossypium harknessii]
MGFNHYLGNCFPFVAEAIILSDNLEVIQVLSDFGLKNPDRLAKLSLTWKSSLQVFDEASKEILELLQNDKE